MGLFSWWWEAKKYLMTLMISYSGRYLAFQRVAREITKIMFSKFSWFRKHDLQCMMNSGAMPRMTQVINMTAHLVEIVFFPFSLRKSVSFHLPIWIYIQHVRDWLRNPSLKLALLGTRKMYFQCTQDGYKERWIDRKLQNVTTCPRVLLVPCVPCL